MHHDAQKLTTTGWPRSSLMSTRPSASARTAPRGQVFGLGQSTPRLNDGACGFFPAAILETRLLPFPATSVAQPSRPSTPATATIETALSASIHGERGATASAPFVVAGS